MEYSQFEYDEQLLDLDWSPHETSYLFDLLRQYDLRFVVVADRYNYLGLRGDEHPRKRSVEVRHGSAVWALMYSGHQGPLLHDLSPLSPEPYCK